MHGSQGLYFDWSLRSLRLALVSASYGTGPPKTINAFGVGSGDIDARDVKAQEAAEGRAEYERPQEYRKYR